MNVAVFFDVLFLGTCLAPTYYLVRTLLQIYDHEELKMLRDEWVPILAAGILFGMYVLETSYFDYMGVFTVGSVGVKDATLFACVSIFAIGTARFAETWGGYVKGVDAKRRSVAQAGAMPNAFEERS